MRAQELYNQFCKKEINEEQFLYHIRRDELLREFISPVNSASDVINILTQRSVITHQIAEDQLIQEKEEDNGEDEHGNALPYDPEFGQEIEEYADGDEDKYQEIDDSYGTPEVRKVLSNYETDNLGFDLPGEAMNAILSHRDWADRWDIRNPADIHTIQAWRQAIVSKRKSGRLKEAKKEKLTPDDVNYYEFTKGWRLELEKTDDIDKAKAKALKNLATDPAYYTNCIAKETQDRMKKTKTDVKEKILKAPSDQVEMKDKEGQMKKVKKGAADKANIKTNLGNKEKAKGAPKGVKTMKLKESLKAVIKVILKESDAYSQHVQAFRDMVKIKPEELAKTILANLNSMTKMRKEFAAKVLGKAVADGNKSPEVKDAFHKLNAGLNEGFEEGDLDVNKLKTLTDYFIKKAGGSKQKAIELVTKEIKKCEDSPNKIAYGRLIKAYTKIVSNLTGNKSVKANPDTFSQNEDKSEDYTCNVCGTKNTKDLRCKCAGKKYPKKEEFSGNTPPEKTDFQDVDIEEEKINKVHPVTGAMHKLLKLKPEETIESKYKSGPDLYNALARKIKDHSKLTGMLAYAANINKKKDVFDAALHHAKKINGNKKDV